MLRALAKATRTHRRDTDSHILATGQDTPPAARLEQCWNHSQGGLSCSSSWEGKMCGCSRSLQIPNRPKSSGETQEHNNNPSLQLRRNQTSQQTLFVDHCRISSSRKIPLEADPRDLEGIKTCVYFHNNGEQGPGEGISDIPSPHQTSGTAPALPFTDVTPSYVFGFQSPIWPGCCPGGVTAQGVTCTGGSANTRAACGCCPLLLSHRGFSPGGCRV